MTYFKKKKMFLEDQIRSFKDLSSLERVVKMSKTVEALPVHPVSFPYKNVSVPILIIVCNDSP